MDLGHPCKPRGESTIAGRTVCIPDSVMKPRVLIFSEKNPRVTLQVVYVKLFVSVLTAVDFGQHL